MTTQLCPKKKCDKRLTYDQSAKPRDKLSCTNTHESVLSRCPAGHCPTGLIALEASIPVGARVRHGACQALLEVVSNGAPAPRLKLA